MTALEKLHQLQADFPSLTKPRQLAEQICKLESKDDRRKALSEVPEAFRDLVRKHVENAFMMRRCKR